MQKGTMSMTLMDDTFEEDTMGMTVSSGSVKIAKDDTNLIGISIGGGAPLCPCVYVVQVFDNTPASRDGTLESGDELVAVQGQSVKGKGKTDVARMIQVLLQLHSLLCYLDLYCTWVYSHPWQNKKQYSEFISQS